jgi:hypothetical protein
VRDGEGRKRCSASCDVEKRRRAKLTRRKWENRTEEDRLTMPARGRLCEQSRRQADIAWEERRREERNEPKMREQHPFLPDVQNEGVASKTLAGTGERARPRSADFTRASTPEAEAGRLRTEKRS